MLRVLFAAVFVVSLFSVGQTFGQTTPRPVYPVIFVHGLTGNDKSFDETLLKLKTFYGWGDICVYDVVLNADNASSTANVSADVKWDDFVYNGTVINVGRRTYADDIDDVEDEWHDAASRVFAVNFAEERIRGALGTFNDYFDGSNQSAIVKQGFALKKVIESVLNYTGAQKVVLVGHSMGGLAIREYLQRTEDGTAFTPHKWWIDKNSPDGHKVAKVVTIGTPHLGSNFGLWPFKKKGEDEKSIVPNVSSEAVRDLRWLYHSVIHGDIPGTYLFGGTENTISQHETYDNYDIDCNGVEINTITGINAPPDGTVDNSSMPLPTNIPYRWITSDDGSSPGVGGDLVVDLPRQWLKTGNEPAPLGITDTLLTNRIHINEGNDWFALVRGLDEPSKLEFAYSLPLSTDIQGIISMGMNYSLNDTDSYKIEITSPGQMKVFLEDPLMGIKKIIVYNSSYSEISQTNVTTFPFTKLYVIETTGTYYIKLIGIASTETVTHPYIINVSLIPNFFNVSFSATPQSGDAPLTVHFTDNSGGSPTAWEWDFNNDGTVESTQQNPTYTYTTAGDYSVKLRVSAGGVSNYAVYTNYIHVNPTNANLPQVTYIEYFFDTDPGFGAGTSIPFSPSSITTISTTLNISSLTDGIHTAYIRAMDANKKWSMKNAMLFYKQSGSPELATLKKAEYYIDTDPGIGSGTSVAFSSGTSAERTFTVNLSSLPDGIHTLNLRATDSNNKWSMKNSVLFYKQNTVTNANNALQKAEYFIDADPGFGAGTSISLGTGQSNVVKSFTVNLSSISDGIHTLYIRAMDKAGNWSMKNSSLFYKQSSVVSGTPKVLRLRYVIYDNQTPSDTFTVNNFTPDTNKTISFNAVSPNLVNGKTYFLHCWAEDENNKRSMRVIDTFTVTTPITINLTALLQGFFENGKMISDTVTVQLHNSSAPYAAIDSSRAVLDTLGRAQLVFEKSYTGNYYLSLRHRNSIETWSKEGGEILTIGTTANYDFSADSLRAFGQNLFKKHGRWCVYSGDVNQDGIVDYSDLSAIDNASFTYLSGYVPQDVTGDGFVDYSDLSITDNNGFYFVSTIKPDATKRPVSAAQTRKEIKRSDE